MLRLLTRRGGSQLPLLSAVVIVVTVGATLLGVCALLLTTSQDRALEEGMSRAAPPEVEVTAFTTNVAGPDARSVADDTRSVVTESLTPLESTTALRAASVMRRLGPMDEEPRRLGYLSAVEGLAERAALTEGRWPRAAAPAGSSGRFEAVVLEPTARQLDLEIGSRVRLGSELGSSAVTSVTVVVVGVFRPLPDSGWDRDPLAAKGYEPDYWDGRQQKASVGYGPFLVDPADLLAGGSRIDRLQLTAHPDLSDPTGAELDAAATALAAAGPRLTRVLGDRVQLQRITSDLPVALGRARAQQDVTRSVVLVAVLLGTALTAVALGLAGRLVDALRTDETALLSVLGASRAQLVATAAAEAAALAALAAVLALPLSALAHSVLTRLPLLADAGLAAPPGVTGGSVAAVVIGALLLAAVLVVPILRPAPETVVATRSRLNLLTRSGSDLLVLALAAVGWWQLRAQPDTEVGTDAVLVLAPVLCLVAGAMVAPRLVSPPLRFAERLARRARGLVLPLAAFEAARRPQAMAAAVLLTLAAATGTFALAFGATWEQSQQDQADARVGTDLALPLTAAPVAGQGPSIAPVTGGVLSAVTDRQVIVGRWSGTTGDQPRVVAVDTRRAGALLRGRAPDGTTWAQVGAALGPKVPVVGVPLPASSADGTATVTFTGTSSLDSALQVIPRLVLQDPAGLRVSCAAQPVPLDGEQHRLRLCDRQSEGLTVVAVSLAIDLAPGSPQFTAAAPGLARLTMTVGLPEPPAAADGAPAPPAVWASTSVGPDSFRLANPLTRMTRGAAGTTLRTTADVNGAAFYPGSPVTVVATAFEPVPAVPVAMSDRMVSELGTNLGAELEATLGGAVVPVLVAEHVPLVPSAPGELAILADVDLLSRALIQAGQLEPQIDAWWVGNPTEGAAEAATSLGLGRVETRAEVSEQLSSGPLRVGLPAALIVLVLATVLLVLAGTVMHVTSDIEARAVEVARLRGLGVSRRHVRSVLLTQHGGLLALLITTGIGGGAVAAWLVGPLLIRSDLGAAPVPEAAVQWPWTAEIALLAVLLLGGLAVVAVVTAVQLRRADTAHLRAGS